MRTKGWGLPDLGDLIPGFGGRRDEFETLAEIVGEIIKSNLREVLRNKPRKKKTDQDPQFLPTERLRLETLESTREKLRKTWRDVKKQKVEDCLSDRIISLIEHSLCERVWRL